jgi:FMN reductase (NADPH)/FMN reductase [NAD(P)H]
MLYSILEIEDQALKERLAGTCDDQPFIARAPWVLLFVADFQKWMDLFAARGCDELPGVPHGVTPGLGDLLMACNDAVIAAQNAVVAAESLGIGSCYIGDIMELGEVHAELLHLPRWTFPVAMLCLGRPKTRPRRTERYERHVVHKDRYSRLTPEELAGTSADLDALHGVRESRDGVRGCVQDVYARKFTADFSVEMNRSVAWWLERWLHGVADGAAGG